MPSASVSDLTGIGGHERVARFFQICGNVLATIQHASSTLTDVADKPSHPDVSGGCPEVSRK
jgi:hypothetical protein